MKITILFIFSVFLSVVAFAQGHYSTTNKEAIKYFAQANSSLDGNIRRAIDFHEGDEIDEDAFKTLIRAAAALNRSSA